MRVGEVVIFVNPAARGGRAGKVWQGLVAAEPRLRGAEVIQGASAEQARAALEAAMRRAPERVIAVGGDGTAHLVGNVLLSSGDPETTAMGLVPAGTGSDWAAGLGLPRQPLPALHQALEAVPRRVDVLRLDTDSGVRRWVLNIASAGVSGAVDERANAIPDRGGLTYIRQSLGALLTYRPAPCRVAVDGEPFYEGPFFILAVANGRTFGKGMSVAPEAVMDDGLADIVMIPPVPLWQLPVRYPQFLTGRHIRLPIVRTRRGRLVRIEPLGELPPYDLDGETLDLEAGEVQLVEGGLRVLA